MDESLFHFRRFEAEDIARIVTLLEEAEVVDHSGEDISEEILRDQLTWTGHDPLQDRWMVELSGEPDKIIAYSVLWKTPTNRHADITAVVHPAWRGRGIGGELLARALQRAREVQAESVLPYADVQHSAAHKFLQQRGFAPVSAYTVMSLVASVPVASPAWPADGYVIRPYSDVQDFSMLLQALNRCYEGLWGHHHLSEDELNAWFPSIDQEGTLLLYAPNGDLVGICRVEMSEQLSRKYGKPMGYVDSPGIVSEYRDNGLYMPLLQAGVQWLRARELVDIELESWGDDERTLAQYQRLGLTIVRQARIWRANISQ